MIERTEVEGFAAVRLRDDGDGAAAGAGPLEATFLPGAGMVGLSLRDRGEELLGQRRGLAAYVRDARTLGIPLLHPWANRLSRDAYAAGGVEVALAPTAAGLHRDANGLAIHGLLAGDGGWEVEEEVASERAAAPGTGAAFAATFDFGARPELLASFPFPHTLRIAVALAGRTLRIETTVTATGAVPVPVAYGFHPYLTLPGLPRTEWRLELPALRRLQLDDRGIPTGEAHAVAADSFLLGARTFDDAFDQVEPGATFVLAGGGRRIAVAFERGFPAAQLYAPDTEEVVCFEPMTAPTDGLVSGAGLRLVRPGERDTTAFSVTVS